MILRLRIPLFMLWLPLLAAAPVGGATYCVDYSRRPDPQVLRAHDFSIVSAEAELDVEGLRASGHRVYAYLSLVEVAKDASYLEAVRSQRVPVLLTNAAWGSWVMDVTDSAWGRFVVEELAVRAMARPFDGFFLDTADGVELLARREPARAAAFRASATEIVRALKRRFPEARLIINRGFSLLEPLRGVVNGVLIESMYQTFDEATRAYRPVPAAESKALVEVARSFQTNGLPVYVLDYVHPTNRAAAAAAARRIAADGFHPFISTPELQGRILGPLREEPRRLLALFGNIEPNIANRVRWPVDSVTANALQTPLEWLGYEVDYLNPIHEELPGALSAQYAGVILDRALHLPAAKELGVAQWLVRQKQAGTKILFTGSLPFQTIQALELILETFGFGGEREILRDIESIEVTARSPHLGFETPLRVQTNHFVHLEAPRGAKLWLALEARLAARATAGRRPRFDPIFTAEWGGALLDPYLFFRRPDYVELWLLDPFPFLAEVFQTPAWPAPDSTTRHGKRLFYSHIDGDGFRHFSSVQAGKRSGEIVIERILKKFPFPFTVSVIEAEIEALVRLQHKDDAVELRQLAVEMFALPNVRAASHSFSHPFFWMLNDRDSVLYEAQRLELKPEVKYPAVDLEREIAGSIEYIERHLLPPGRKVELFLWSGNCRPPPEALHMLERLGVENMNGGDTTYSSKHPSLTRVAPRAMPWNGALQVFAANQNENVYQERWQFPGATNTPFLPGFVHALETFKLTETPRRLKPVNIYFHFYSADSLAALRALLALFDYATESDLHAVTAVEYAQIVRDCRRARLFRDLDEGWILISEGDARTLRLPAGSAPDLTRSTGALGFLAGTHCTYVHTDGAKRIRLSIAPMVDVAPRLRLEASSAPIQFSRLTPSEAVFKVRDLRPARVTLAGLPASAPVRLEVDGKVSSAVSTPEGRLELTLPGEASVAVLPPKS